MNKVVKIIIAIVLVVLIVVGIVFLIDLDRMNNNQEVLFSTWGRDYTPKTSRNNTTIENMVNNNISENKIGTNTDENTISGSDVENNDSNEIGIVTSLEDKISDDSAWCGTFNLVWNDLKNDLAKQDIVFNPQLDMVKNLNKGTFNVSQLSENSYYKVYGRPTFQLKSQIEKAIKDKFNETSKILDDFEWSDDATGYFLYSMLKKKFEFPKEFTKLSNGKFRNYNNVKYFGIDEKTSDEVKAQLEVLYYNSKDNFAIKINTKQNDEVIVAKGRSEDNFGEMYQKILNEEESYKGNRRLSDGEIFKMPNITFNLKKRIEEVENKPFKFSDGSEYIIYKAMQTIKFELNEKGGEVISEAGIGLKESIALDSPAIREFLVDDTFTIFLKETGKELPYFGAKISNIENVQNLSEN